jgi:alpha,alpha-trehalase
MQFLQRFRTKKPWPKLIPGADKPSSPRKNFGAVFDVVQLSRTFTDSKTFVDMIPKRSPRKILKRYFRQYGAQLDIARFVRDNFIEPEQVQEIEISNQDQPVPMQVREYVKTKWSTLTREAHQPMKYSSLLALPFRYVIPGGRFREIFYWDSYFTMLGLREDGNHDLIEDMIRNFAHMISRYGFIPNGNRTYYLTRSQPPLFAMMVSLLAEIKGESVLSEYRHNVYKEYDFWMRGSKNSRFVKGQTPSSERVVRMPDGELLNRYFDDSISPREESFREDVEIGRYIDEAGPFYRNMRAACESGWDFSSRWLADCERGRKSTRTTDIVPVDLNIFLLLAEELLSRIYQREKKFNLSTKYGDRAKARHDAVQKYFWNEKTGWYHDYVLSEQNFSPHISLAGVMPLFAGVATAKQASEVARKLEKDFLRPGGVVTTLQTTEEQWDAPNGWPPLQYFTIMALERYGAHELAKDIASRWCALNIAVYEQTGQLFEKYNVEEIDTFATGGEYEVQEGFGWTNGILITLMNKYHINEKIPEDIEMPKIEEMHEAE